MKNVTMLIGRAITELQLLGFESPDLVDALSEIMHAIIQVSKDTIYPLEIMNIDNLESADYIKTVKF